MEDIENSMREVARKLLSEKKVAFIIGYEQGTLPLHTTPCFVTRPEDVEKLVWNASCDANLAKYVVGTKEKVAVVAKGCDARSIAVCAIEKQFSRENVFVIGIPCSGVIDRKKIEAELGDREALEATIKNEQVKVRGQKFELVLPKKDILSDSCLTCRHKNPPICDVLVGEEVPETTDKEEFAEVVDFESKPTEARWEHFKEELSKCIRCYACRNICPLCYCKVCFVDQTMPAWFGKTNNLSDTMIYHVVRALHVAGRCVDCGACSRACPMNIDLRKLMRKTEKIMKELYNYEAGVNLEEVPPLGEFKMEDSEEFIK